MKSSAGGTLLYITNHLSYKSRNELCIYKSTELESRYSDILNPEKTNVTVVCILRHLHIGLNEFNDYYVNNLLDRLSKENKTVFLLCDFNIDLLNYNQHSPNNEILTSLSSHMLLPHIQTTKRNKK